MVDTVIRVQAGTLGGTLAYLIAKSYKAQSFPIQNNSLDFTFS